MCRLVRLSRDRGQSVIGMYGEVFPGVIMLCREARSQHGVVLITYPEWEMGEVVSYEGGDWMGGLEIHPVYIHLSMTNPTCNLYFFTISMTCNKISYFSHRFVATYLC